MENNLIQNFYVVGVSYQDIISSINSNQNLDSLNPKILSIFPTKNACNLNKISENVIIEHCFPNDFNIKKGEKYDKYLYHFEFAFENKNFQFLDKNRCLYSKIHFTCVKFYEPIIDYFELNSCINNKNIKQNDFINNEDIIKKYEEYYIPKVICFASIMPFSNELQKILINIYDFYKHQKNYNLITYPIEKIIEQIVMSLPIPIMKDFDVILSFELDSFSKDIFTYKKITFYSYEFRDYFLNKSYDLDIHEIFLFNSEETIINIFKNILLEIPVLFFSENKKYLSSAIEIFLNILSPFKYVHPNIPILPSIYYGLITSQEKFIFGINQKYSDDFFSKNEIPINKNILIVIISKNKKNEVTLTTKEISFNEKDKKKSILLNGDTQHNNINNIFNVELPIKYKKKLSIKLKNYVEYVMNNIKNKKFENKNVFKSTILNLFQKFFINILSGYTKFLLKSPNHNYFGNNIRHIFKEKNGEINYIKDIFNINGFLSSIPKEYQIFYHTFFNTKIFFNYIRGIIYPKNEIDSLVHKYFDFLTFLKKEKTQRKSEEFSEQYQKYKKPFGKKKKVKNINIVINDNYYFNDNEIKILKKEEKMKKALDEYYQLIENKDEEEYGESIFSIRYFTFPKLLFDNCFFDINYNYQFYNHYIDLPSNKPIKELNSFITESENEFLSKCCFIIYKDSSNAQSPFFDLYSNDYIEFTWLLLSSCSLWYCNTKKEIEIRINKIFDVLEKLDYIEEQILLFVFYSIYEYGNISQFIRIFEYVNRFLGYYSYYNLILLFDKLKQEKKGKSDLIKDDDKNDEINIEKRSLIDIKKYIDNANNDDNTDEMKEEIIFYNEQKCEKCGGNVKLNEQDISEIINKKIDKTKNTLIFKCKNCNMINFGIKINFKISLINKKKKKQKLISEDKFNLISPHLLYLKIKDYLIKLNENKLDINHIFSNNNIDLLNFIFYFSLKYLPFDFLLPYERSNNNTEEREFYFNYDYINKKVRKKFENISIIYNENNILNISNNK